jgi:hypothetical protein
MLRSALSAILLVGVLAAAQPAGADPLSATASDRVRAMAAATEQRAPLPAPIASTVERGIATAGFGWG